MYFFALFLDRYGVGLYCDVSCSKRVGAMRRWYGMGASSVKRTPHKARALTTRPTSKSASFKSSTTNASRPPRRSMTRSHVARQLQWTDSADGDGNGARGLRPVPQPSMLHHRTHSGNQELDRQGRTSTKTPAAAVNTGIVERGVEKVQGSERAQVSQVTHTSDQTKSSPNNPSAQLGTAATSHVRFELQAAQLRQPGLVAPQVVLPTLDGRHKTHGTASKPGPSKPYPVEESNVASVSAVTLSASPRPSGMGASADARETEGLVGEQLELYYYSCGWTAVDVIAYRPDSDEHRVRRCTDRREHWASLRYCRVRFSAGEDEIE